VLELLESPPKETDIDKHLSVLALTPGMLSLPSNSALEEVLCCSIFLWNTTRRNCRNELHRLLGSYAHLVTFIAYVKTCHVWMEAHRKSYESDKRVQDNLGALLEDEPGLADFSKITSKKVKRELAESWSGLRLSRRKRTEEKSITQTVKAPVMPLA